MNPSGISQFNQARIEWAIRLKYSPMPRLDMELLAGHLNEFRIGELRTIGKLWEIMMERDAELAVNSEKRKADAAGLDWQVVSDGSLEGDRHAAALQYFYDRLNVTRALEQDFTGGADQLIKTVLSALDYYYSAHEMLLRVDNAAAREVTAEFRHTPVWFFEARRGYLGYLKHIFDLYGVPCVQGEWLTAVNYGWMRPLSLVFALKAFTLRDWGIFNARYGSGFLHGTTDATQGQPEWEQALEAINTLANDGAVLTNRQVTFSILQQAARNANPFHPLVEWCNALYAKCYRGVDLATGSRAALPGADGQAGAGGRHPVGSSIQKEESGIFLVEDAKWVTGVFNERIDRPIIRYLFGHEPRAWFALIPPLDETSAGDLQAIRELVRMGFKVALKEVYKRFRWTVPEPDDPCLTAPGLKPAVGNQQPDGESPPSAVPGPRSDGQSPEPAAQTPDARLAGNILAPRKTPVADGQTRDALGTGTDPIAPGANPRYNPSLREPEEADALTTVRMQSESRRDAGDPGSAGVTPARFRQAPDPAMPDTQVDAASFWSRAGLMPRGADGRELPAPSLGYSLPNDRSAAGSQSGRSAPTARLAELERRGLANSRAAQALRRELAGQKLVTAVLALHQAAQATRPVTPPARTPIGAKP